MSAATASEASECRGRQKDRERRVKRRGGLTSSVVGVPARVTGLLAVLLLLGTASAATAQAVEVTGSQLRELGARAAEDDDARAELERVDRVDGRPVAMRQILAGARDEDVEQRVELALSMDDGGTASSAGSSAAPREQAREVLQDRRFTGTQLPRPFARPLRWLQERLQPVERFFRKLIEALPGGSRTADLAFALLALVLVLVATVLTTRFLRRRASDPAGTGERRGSRRQDPAELERAADLAESQERWADAVRLRFQAGVLRLYAEGVLAYRPSLTTGEIARALESEEFDLLRRDFDAIAYGGRPAASEDASGARERWKTLRARVKS